MPLEEVFDLELDIDPEEDVDPEDDDPEDDDPEDVDPEDDLILLKNDESRPTDRSRR